MGIADGPYYGPKRGWQPIETAPFDDGTVQVLLRGKFPRTAYHYSDSFGKHISDVDAPWSNEWDEIATHWMPIPAF